MKKILICCLIFFSGCKLQPENVDVINASWNDDLNFQEPATFSFDQKEYDLTSYSNEYIYGNYTLELEFDGWIFVDHLPGFNQVLDDFTFSFWDNEKKNVEVLVETATSNRLVLTSNKEINYVYIGDKNSENYVAWQV